MKLDWGKLSDKEKMGVVAGGGALIGLVALARKKSGSSTATSSTPAKTYSIPASAGGGGSSDPLGSSSGSGFNQDTGAMASALTALSAQLAALPSVLSASISASATPVTLASPAAPTDTTKTATTPAPASAPATLTRNGWQGTWDQLVSAVGGGQLLANVSDPTAKAAITEGLGSGLSVADSLSAGRYAGQAAQWYASQNPAPAGNDVLWTAPTAAAPAPSTPTTQGVTNKLNANPAL